MVIIVHYRPAHPVVKSVLTSVPKCRKVSGKISGKVSGKVSGRSCYINTYRYVYTMMRCLGSKANKESALKVREWSKLPRNIRARETYSPLSCSPPKQTHPLSYSPLQSYSNAYTIMLILIYNHTHTRQHTRPQEARCLETYQPEAATTLSLLQTLALAANTLCLYSFRGH